MIPYGKRFYDLKVSVIEYIKGKLDEKSEYIIGKKYEELEEDEDGEKIGEEDGIFEYYHDDGHYTVYRLVRAYKDNEGYFIEGFSEYEDNDFQFYLESGISLETLCEIADAIHFEPVKHLT